MEQINRRREGIFDYYYKALMSLVNLMGYTEGQLPITEDMSSRLLRLPFYYDMTEDNQVEIVDTIKSFFKTNS